MVVFRIPITQQSSRAMQGDGMAANAVDIGYMDEIDPHSIPLEFTTKAATLQQLSARGLHHAVIDPVFAFSLWVWDSEHEAILGAITNRFPNQTVIVRSSAVGEDGVVSSMAGYFHSEADVPSSSRDRLHHAIDRVVNSYAKDRRLPNPLDQVLVQPQVQDVAVAGVVFTRDGASDSPYYVINYDDRTGTTDGVTAGTSSRVLRLARWRSATTLPIPWRRILLAVQELEQICGERPLDIEFAVDRDGVVHVFQVRPLIAAFPPVAAADRRVETAVQQLEGDLEVNLRGAEPLAGSRTVLADMPDWNPAEILGGRPNVLDRSLYRFLITRSTWNAARVSLGYVDVSPFELMVTIADKPYIDAQVSFNSLTPTAIPSHVRDELIDFYLAKLERHPELQDKVEFEIVFNCFDLSFEERARELAAHGMRDADIALLRNGLRTHTNWLLGAADDLIAQDLQALHLLSQHTAAQPACPPNGQLTLAGALREADRLLVACRDFGTFTFSRLARLAFVGMALLKSLVRHGVMTPDDFERFMGSLNSVASGLTRAVSALARDDLTLDDFLEQYGHLRAGTYSVLSPRYDKMPNLFENANSTPSGVVPLTVVADAALGADITAALERHGIHSSGEALLTFAKQTLEYREDAKFQFTKALSTAIELLAHAGALVGLSREEVACIDLETLMRFRDADDRDIDAVRSTWREVAATNADQHALYRRIALPPVLVTSGDLTAAENYASKPNFVTRKRIEGPVFDFRDLDYGDIPSLADRIVLIENADPGYDWIFTRHPLGLITKHGGVASHMAIRCAELGVPAAVGCGETLFDQALMAGRVDLDCSTERITPL